MSPKHENLCNSHLLSISMFMCYSIANHEPSTMYLSNSLLQGIPWGHRSTGSIGIFLKTTILVLEPLKGRSRGSIGIFLKTIILVLEPSREGRRYLID